MSTEEFAADLKALKLALEVNQNAALTDDLKLLFQDELELLSKAAKDNTLSNEYIQGCRYRLARTLGAIAIMG